MKFIKYYLISIKIIKTKKVLIVVKLKIIVVSFEKFGVFVWSLGVLKS